jgi:regulator of protease activity HflC (stomatin/prohibitin superfamily)
MLFIILCVCIAIATCVCCFFLPIGKAKILGAAGLLFGIALVFCSATVAPTGTIKVLSWFGSIQPGYIPDHGLTFINPLAGTTDVNVQRQEVVHEDPQIRTATNGDNYLTVDVVMPYSVNSETAWKLLSKIQDPKTMMNRQADAALRQGISQHSWTDAVNNADGKVATSIGAAWKAMVTSQLVTAGLTPTEAENAFTFYPVQIRKALPDQVVQDATAAKSAATQNLDTQTTITSIAAQIANRRSNEGEGLNNLLRTALGLKEGEKLPANISIDQISRLVGAVADLERAGAIVKIADDTKRPLTVILNSGGQSPVAIAPGSADTAPVVPNK